MRKDGTQEPKVVRWISSVSVPEHNSPTTERRLGTRIDPINPHDVGVPCQGRILYSRPDTVLVPNGVGWSEQVRIGVERCHGRGLE